MDAKKNALSKHSEWQGKIEIVSRVSVKTREQLSVAYTPGVAEPCLAIQQDVSKSFTYTRRWNTVAVITDGTAVLGLGDIGPEAGMPVMEGKCVLFKEFGEIDAIPLCIRSKNVDEIVRTVYLLSGSFGGINLEDISAPRCFEIERKLKEVCDIPVFHDDQHGTAVVVAAALFNVVKITGKNPATMKIVINGAGAAGIAIARHLLNTGFTNILLVDSKGIIREGRADLGGEKAVIAGLTNRECLSGGLAEAMAGADAFIGVSAPGIVSGEMIRCMSPDPVVFPLSNPVPEIMPNLALQNGAKIVGTGRSDFPNQINNVLAFPGIFRGALDVRASCINEEMKVAASHAIASLVSDRELCPQYILPSIFAPDLGLKVAKAVAEAARKSGVSGI